MTEHTTADYRTVADGGGTRYRFYCQVSGALACTTKPYPGEDAKAELRDAWESEGKNCFNLCHRCGRWVVDAVYNPEVFECTDCATFEHETRYCKSCGKKVDADVRFCPFCKSKLHYEGGESP